MHLNLLYGPEMESKDLHFEIIIHKRSQSKIRDSGFEEAKVKSERK